MKEPANSAEGGVDLETNYHDFVNEFDDLKLKPNVLRGIYSYGYERPSSIQQRAIKPCIEGRDVLAQAQSGTGKTGAFTISILQRIDASVLELQALILTPTRELAKQIQIVVHKIGTYMNIKAHPCVGGTRTADDVNTLKTGVHVVVGTPGRVFDMINRRSLATSQLKLFVLDEADEMLSRGFRDQIEQIYSFLPTECQIMLFSATMPKDIVDVTTVMMKDPIRILLKKEELTLDGIKQFYVRVAEEKNKLDTLLELYQVCNLCQVVIFLNTISKSQSLCDGLVKENFPVSCIHGQMSQEDRDTVMQSFRSGLNRVLIATDVLSRGIDVQTVSLVINYDLPTNRETYIHRIGRGGRFGRKGTAINFITVDDEPMLAQLMDYYSTEILELPENVLDLI